VHARVHSRRAEKSRRAKGEERFMLARKEKKKERNSSLQQQSRWESRTNLIRMPDSRLAYKGKEEAGTREKEVHAVINKPVC